MDLLNSTNQFMDTKINSFKQEVGIENQNKLKTKYTIEQNTQTIIIGRQLRTNIFFSFQNLQLLANRVKLPQRYIIQDMQRNISTPNISKKSSSVISQNDTALISPQQPYLSSQISGYQQAQPQQQQAVLQQQSQSTAQQQIQTQLPAFQYVSSLNISNTPIISALSAAIYCQSKLIYDKNGSEALEIASLTKVMTFFTSLKLCAKHDIDTQSVYVKVPKFAAYICGTTAYLRDGEYILLNDLFYALMLPSGNDAACTLANFFGQLELKKQTTHPLFFDEEETQNLKELYGFNIRNKPQRRRCADQGESELSTDTQGNESKDSGDDEINISGEDNEEVKRKTSINCQSNIKKMESQTNNIQQQIGVQSQEKLNNTNKSNQIKFHQQQGDVKDNMKYFVKLMNQEATKLQMRTTQYSNPHGLSDKGNKSSAIDYGKLCFAAMSSFAQFREVVKTPQYSCQILINKDLLTNKNKNNSSVSANSNESTPPATPQKPSQRKASWENTNKLLKKNIYFIGIKTGHTPNAGPCLATHYQRDGIEIQVIVLKCKDSEKRWIDSQKLAEWAFGQIKQEVGAAIHSDQVLGNGRLISAQRNRLIKFQQPFQDEFTKLLQQNKEEDPNNRSKLGFDFNIRNRPKSTAQIDNFYVKSNHSIGGNSQLSQTNLSQIQNISSYNQLQTERIKSTQFSRNNIDDYLQPKGGKGIKDMRRGNMSSIFGSENKNHNASSSTIIRNNAINKDNKNINKNENESTQILNKDTYHQFEDNGSNNDSIQILSDDDFDVKEENINIGANMSFDKNDDEQGNEEQLLSESFEQNMEELLHFKTQSQKNIPENTSMIFNQQISNKKFSSQCNLDKPSTASTARSIIIKKNLIQQSSQKPKIPLPRPLKNNQQQQQSDSNSNSKLISPRRKVIYAKQQNNAQETVNPTTKLNNLVQKNAIVLIPNNSASRIGSDRIINLQKSESKQPNPQTLSNNPSNKFINTESKLPPLINKSLNFSSKKQSEDIISPPKSCSKNQSLVKQIFS